MYRKRECGRHIERERERRREIAKEGGREEKVTGAGDNEQYPRPGVKLDVQSNPLCSFLVCWPWF